MANEMTQLLLWAAALSTGLIAGIYLAFSMFIMTSLKALNSSIAIACMNSINKLIIGSGFMPLFFGSSLLSLLIVLFGPDSLWLNSAAIIYLGGMLGCTLRFNVPLNKRLQYAPTQYEDQVWQRYAKTWTRWNHIRTLSSLYACIIYINAL